ncbi:MAG: hypothetical protein AB7V07_02370 [Candidatus Delongbacteria bacterium]
MRDLFLFFFGIFITILNAQTDSLFTRLPENIYTTNTSKYSVYYKNVVLTQHPEDYSFSVNCPVGFDDGDKYNLDSLNSGIYPLCIDVKDSLGNLLGTDGCQLLVTENNISQSDTLRMLFVGNSLTYAGKYERNIKTLMDESGSYPVKFLGTQFYNEQDSIDGIFHEGRAGWSWGTYCRSNLSPFVYSEFPGVDVERYLHEKLNDEIPDIVIFFLGVNDIFGINSTSLETIDAGITDIFKSWNMGLVIDEFEEALPNTPIGIVLIPVANERLEPWYLQYGDSAKAWEYRQCQHRLEQRYIDHYNDLSRQNFSMIPVYPNIDTYNGYYETDARHPNLLGYNQISHSIYGWIKYQISQWMKEPENLIIVNSGSCASLSWDLMTGAAKYNIYRSPDPYAGFTLIGSTDGTSFIDPESSGSDQYFYRVTAENSLKNNK